MGRNWIDKDIQVVYVAGKYSATTPEEIAANVKAAEDAGKRLLEHGIVPIIPHRISHGWENCEKFKDWQHEEWIERYCLPMLSICDTMVVLPNSELSKGVQMEREFAEHLGIEVIPFLQLISECENDFLEDDIVDPEEEDDFNYPIGDF